MKLADKYEGGWDTVNEYLSDELASDSEYEKRIRRAESIAQQKRKKRSMQQNRIRRWKLNLFIRPVLPVRSTLHLPVGETGSFFGATVLSVVSNTPTDAPPAELPDIGGSTARTLLPPVHIPKLNLTENNTSFFNKYINTSSASSDDAQCCCVSNVQSSVDCNVQFLEASEKQAQVSTIHQAYLCCSRNGEYGNVYAVQHSEACVESRSYVVFVIFATTHAVCSLVRSLVTLLTWSFVALVMISCIVLLISSSKLAASIILIS